MGPFLQFRRRKFATKRYKTNNYKKMKKKDNKKTSEKLHIGPDNNVHIAYCDERVTKIVCGILQPVFDDK